MVSCKYINFWPNILLFRTYDLRNSTTELTLKDLIGLILKSTSLGMYTQFLYWNYETLYESLITRSPYNVIHTYVLHIFYGASAIAIFSLYVMILLSFFVCLFCQLDFLNPFVWSLIIGTPKSYKTVELNNFYCLSNGWRRVTSLEQLSLAEFSGE